MRIKSKGVLVSQPAYGSYQDYKSSTNTPYGSLVQFSSPIVRGMTEVISYDDSKRSGPVKTTRFCDHKVVAVETANISESYYLSPGTYYRKTTHHWTPGLPSTDLELPNVAALHGEAMQFFKAGCQDQEIDLGANLFELKQAITLVPNLLKTLKGLHHALRTKSVKHTLKKSADIHLTYAFGVKPLVSDVSVLCSTITSLAERISWLRKNSGNVVRIDFRKDLSADSFPAPRVLFDNANEKGVCVTSEYRAYYHAFASVTYDVSQLSNMELRLRLLTRRFGLDKPLGTAWELTPWSFVVDWVFDVGQWLDRVTPSITLPIRFQDLGYSVKVIRKDIHHLERKNPQAGTGKFQAGIYRSRYVRYPGLPISFSSLSENDLTLRQLALSMSLSLQKWR